jgi:SAM-dependent methyltransferase
VFTSQAIARYDVVYSLGFIEHFDDLEYVVRHHLKYLKPGGTLILGCPNWRGVYRGMISWLSPARFKVHNLAAMDARNWDGFEHSLGLTRLFRGYVGGFEPSLLATVELPGLAPHLVGRGARGLSKLLRLPIVRTVHGVNHSAIRGYLLGVYRG